MAVNEYELRQNLLTWTAEIGHVYVVGAAYGIKAEYADFMIAASFALQNRKYLTSEQLFNLNSNIQTYLNEY